MSFCLTFIFNDKVNSIRTRINGSYTTIYADTTFSNVTSIGSTRANLVSGYELDYWVIAPETDGGGFSLVFHDDDNPTSFSEINFEDGYAYTISVVVTDGVPKWTMEMTSLKIINATASITVQCDAGVIYCIQFRSNTPPGTAMFYATGNYDTVGFFSTEYPELNTSNGEITNAVIRNDDHGSDLNFQIEYGTDAGSQEDFYPSTTYYLCVRHYDITSSGSFTVVIVPPTSAQEQTGDGIYIYTGPGSGQGWKKVTPYIYNGRQWVPCRPAICISVNNNEASWVIGTND